MNDAVNIVRKLQRAGYESYFVGGCVRDMILRIENHDYDIATAATPEEVKEVFSSSKFVGQNFGVSIVRINNKDYEIATFRTDSSYTDSRHPDTVEYTRSLKEDASRRDLTINAIYYDPVDHIYKDPFFGMNDIAREQICFVGNAEGRIKEDPLRLLRAIRFKLKFGFRYDEETKEAIIKHSSDIRFLSIERVRDEMFKIIKLVKPSEWIYELTELDLVGWIFYELVLMHRTPQDSIWHPEGNVLKHSVLVADYLFETGKSFETVMSGLFHDLGKVTTTQARPEPGSYSSHGHAKESARLIRKMAEEMKFSNELTETMAEVAYDHMSLLDYENMKKSTIKRYMNKPHSDILLDVIEADVIGTGYAHKINPGTILKKMKEQFIEENSCNPEPLVTGKDLISLGLKPGPSFSAILYKIQELQLEGEISEKEEAIKIIEEMKNDIN